MRNDSRLPQLLGVAFFAASVVAVLQCAELAFLALSRTGLVPGAVWNIGFGAELISVAATIFIVRWSWRRGGVSLPEVDVRRTRVLIRLAIGVLVVVALAAVIVTIVNYDLPAALSAGQPLVRDGKYVLGIHGSYREITFAQYRLAMKAQQQSFIAFSVAFYLVAALAVMFTSARQKRKVSEVGRFA